MANNAFTNPSEWEEMPEELFANADLDFDPQAFFDDYLYNGRLDDM